MQDILQVLGKAATVYTRKNLRILYDALSTLADGVGPAMGQPELLKLFMPPLLQKWHQFQDMDRELMPLMEAFTSLATALGQPSLLCAWENISEDCHASHAQQTLSLDLY